MTKSRQGHSMRKDQPNPAKGVQAAANSFAPVLINDGGEGRAREVEPAKLAEPPAEVERVEDSEEADFLTYFKGELTSVADKLGYDISLKKRAAQSGPVMLYDPDSREGRVFGSREEAPTNFLSGDQLQALYAIERESAE